MREYKVVITDREYENIENETRILNEINGKIWDYQYRNKDCIIKVTKDADAVIVQYAKMPAEVIEQLDHCKIIAKYATGYDGIDLEAATKKGIYVCNVPDYCSDEVSSHTLALLMEMSRRVGKYNGWIHKGNWFSMPGKQHSLRKQVIGIIGFGKIAKGFIEKVKPLCDTIWVYDNHNRAKEIIALGAIPKTFEEIIIGGDYISLHCPLTDRTYHLFDKEVFVKMKQTAVIINMARGSVIAEQDLIWAIENGQIGGAALDVLEKEPPDKDNPLLQFDNVIITPHIAWYSVESQRKLQSVPAEEIVRVFKGQEPLNVVNKEVLKGRKQVEHE